MEVSLIGLRVWVLYFRQVQVTCFTEYRTEFAVFQNPSVSLFTAPKYWLQTAVSNETSSLYSCLNVVVFVIADNLSFSARYFPFWSSDDYEVWTLDGNPAPRIVVAGINALLQRVRWYASSFPFILHQCILRPIHDGYISFSCLLYCKVPLTTTTWLWEYARHWPSLSDETSSIFPITEVWWSALGFETIVVAWWQHGHACRSPKLQNHGSGFALLHYLRMSTCGCQEYTNWTDFKL